MLWAKPMSFARGRFQNLAKLVSPNPSNSETFETSETF